MIVQAICFYVFAAIGVASGAMVVTARNPVHSVLFLILAFFNVAALFILMGAEFLAMVLVIVYVGAVAVLFLFVVMMLDIDFVKLRQGAVKYLPIGATIGIILAVELVLIFGAWAFEPRVTQALGAPVAGAHITNTAALGDLLYTKYVYVFQASGVILLIAMIGAIVLTLQHKPDVRRQKIGAQVSRRRAETLALVQPKVGEGIGEEQGVR